MKEVIIATKNPGKAREFEHIFASRGIEVRTLLDFPEIPDVDETGSTFEENAILKAEAVSQALGKMVIGDDSGLMVDALEGRPGIYSARYAGEPKNDQNNTDKVLSELKGLPDEKRSARFYCALAVAVPGQETITVSGTCEGRILEEQRGTNGFGYDPVFYVPEKSLAMAELSSDEKNKISHRANALKKLDVVLDSILERAEK
ncbi:XTP/dITP diphosphatase [Bacillus sp. ISL-40]|uniref:XTP/dITP diphosphatase n=1 Tax=unclassified Bacillus (in: firmicutes) TaxID=185979 RepID=UPI001BE53467|nr:MULTISPECIES: XTP/dITP diphosphatase [unclassified Bacillus (in: firmicutes)]MBT2697875.1 XTP/dITP diphosphatase [Bacillus sp. ISL-40]MBT2721536.1 XTP/dITP diphosphatase [Bacillus sp. ISL-46]MBT2727035.1 XTP/dITP diphosphatase [Bacillus sp. ISL-75]